MSLNQFENLLKQRCNYVKSRWRKAQEKKLQRFSINFQVAFPRIGTSVPYCEIVFQLFPLPSIFPNWLVQPSTARQLGRVHSERHFKRTLGSWPILYNGNLLKYDSNEDIRILHIEKISSLCMALWCASKAWTSHSSLIGGPFNKMRLKIQNTNPSFLLLLLFSVSPVPTDSQTSSDFQWHEN